MNDIEEIIHRLKQAVRLFHEAGIHFVLIGGLAMRAHGANNMTTDADFAYAVDADNLDLHELLALKKLIEAGTP